MSDRKLSFLVMLAVGAALFFLVNICTTKGRFYLKGGLASTVTLRNASMMVNHTLVVAGTTANTTGEPSVQNTTHEAVPPSINQTGLWIYVSSWGEGLSNWRRSLAEILVVARHLNATLVEPCVKNGRLLSCGYEDGLIRLGDVFNLTRTKEFHPAISSYEQFEKRTKDAAKHFTICMHVGTPRDACGNVKNLGRSKSSTELDQSVNASVHGLSVLEVIRFRKSTFLKMEYNGSPLIRGGEIDLVLDQYLTFRKEQYDHVDNLLQKMGVNGTFAVIQWRAEIKGIDYMPCARAILKAREIMNMSHTSFVLMSSLNMDENLQWGGVKMMSVNTSSHAALTLLLESGFHKLDRVVEEVQDMFLLAVWDLILAIKADAFATCSGCKSICSKCNRQGSFVKLPVQLRKKIGKETISCWPS